MKIKSSSEIPSINGDRTNSDLPDVKPLKYNTVLRVAPFPYMPDPWDGNNAHLLQFIHDEFQKIHPEIQLILRPMNTSDDFYDITFLTDLLTNDKSGYDIVEIDTVVLGDLVDLGLVTPLTNYTQSTPVASDWHPAAYSAVQINRATYAFPHLMCAFYLFTHGNITDRRLIYSLPELVGYVNKANIINGILYPYMPYRLVGNLDSSWDLSALWIDSQSDNSFTRPSHEADSLHGYEYLSFENMLTLAQLCNISGRSNQCLDGTFRNDQEKPAKLFADYQARAMFGYSERLFYVLKNGPISNFLDVKIQPLPLGKSMHGQLFFTDAYVFRRNLSPDKLAAAHAFANFMASPRMQAALVTNEEFSSTKLFRYLLPMAKSAYNHQMLQQDRFYVAYFFDPEFNGISFPNTGFLKTRKQLSSAIKKYITKP